MKLRPGGQLNHHIPRCVRLTRHVTSWALFACVVLVFALAGCGGSNTRDRELIVSGSTTLLPIAEISGERFGAREGDTKVLVSGQGSAEGIKSVAKGSSDIGTSSRDLTEEESSLGLHDTPVALDAIAVIVNPSNPVEGLTIDQVRAIFGGTITSWSQLGGPDKPIGLVNRDEASGTREAFRKIVMGETPFDSRAAVLPGTGQVRSVVAESTGGIGYISLGFVNDDVRAVAIDGIAPSEGTVVVGDYPIRRVLHFFTLGKPEGSAAEYIDYVLSAEVQSGIIRDAGFIPIGAEGR